MSGARHIVVANAGVEVIGQRMLDVTEADFDRISSSNAKGAMLKTKGGVPDSDGTPPSN